MMGSGERSLSQTQSLTGVALHGLFDELDMPVLGQPFDHFQRVLLGLPAFIGVHPDRLGRGDLAQRFDVYFIVGHADLHFQHRVGRRFLDFFADDVRLINADGEGADVVILAEAQPQVIVNGFVGQLGRPVKQRDVERALGRHIVRRERVQIHHAPLDILEGKPPRVHPLQESFHGVQRFAVAGDGRRFPPAHRAVRAGEFDHDGLGGGRAAAAGDGPQVS